MLKQQAHASGDRGWIINTSSILGYVGAEHTAAYCASKGAVLNFTRAAALDCAPHRIHVNGVAPGYTESSMTGPIWRDEKAYREKLAMHPFGGRLGQPDDLAKACVFLASEDAQWVTGVSIARESVATAADHSLSIRCRSKEGIWQNDKSHEQNLVLRPRPLIVASWLFSSSPVPSRVAWRHIATARTEQAARTPKRRVPA